MRKHQFVKADCNCPRRATFFTCKHCGSIEYCGQEEIQSLPAMRAACSSEDAPVAAPAEAFKAKLGGPVDCLAPDYATWQQSAADKPEP